MKNKFGRGVLITLLIYAGIIVLGIGTIITLNIVRKNNEKKLAARFEYTFEASAQDKLLAAYQAEKIDADTYVRYCAYALYDTKSLPVEYQSDYDYDESVDILQIAAAHSDELSDETRSYILRHVMLSDVKIGPDASSNVETACIESPFTLHASAAEPLEDSEEEPNVTILDHAILTKNGKYLIWYTKTGVSQVSDSDMKKLAKNLEQITEDVFTTMNVNWRYNNETRNEESRAGMVEVLKNCNIDESAIDTAMSVYVYEPSENASAMAWYSTNLSGFYEALWKIGDKLLTADEMGEWGYVYAMPYVVIRSSSVSDEDSLNIIFAHEITHHAQRLYYDNLSYIAPMFPSETVANVVACEVVEASDTYTPINRHAERYMENMKNYRPGTTRSSDTKGIGYWDYLWGKSYIDTVDNGLEIMKKSLLEDDPAHYLRVEAGLDYVKVLEDLAVRNITKDYEEAGYQSASFPDAFENLSPYMDTCEHTLTGNELNYYYFDMKRFTKLKSTLVVSLDDSAGYNSFMKVIGRKRNNYTVIDTVYFEEEDGMILDFSDDTYASYDELIIAIGYAESRPDECTTYKMQIVSGYYIDAYENFVGMTETDAITYEGDCTTIVIDDIVDASNQFASGSADLRDVLLAEVDTSTEDGALLSDGMDAIFAELTRFNTDLQEFGDKFPYEVVRIYTIPITNTTKTDDELHAGAIEMLVKPRYSVFDTTQGDQRISVGVSIQPLSDAQLSFYTLITNKDSDPLFYKIVFEK